MGGLLEHRARLHLVALAGLLLVVGLVIAVAATGGDEEVDRAQEGSPFAGALIADGVRAPDFELADQDGRPVRLSDFRGRVVVATFVYSQCTESCGPQVQLIRGALDDLGRDIPALAISADSRSDTPQRARRFLLEQRMTGRARFLLGSARELRPVYEGFFVQPQTDEQEHQARLVLIDQRGFQRVGYTISNATSEQIAHDIEVLETERA